MDSCTDAVGSAIGKVVIKKSERSLVRPRKATADTGTEELKVNVPLTGDPELNGA